MDVVRSYLDKNKTAIIFASIALVLVVISLYFYNKYQTTQRLLGNPTQASQQEAQALVAQVGKLIELPTGEQPTIATVSDKTKLADQPFFQNAQNGDKVLIYSAAKKAILYRPSMNKIIEVAPVNLGTNQISPAPAVVTQTASPTLVPTTIQPTRTP